MSGEGTAKARTVAAGGLLAEVPDRLTAERFDEVLSLASVRIERIVSTGQTTPEGEWFDQDWDEWVMLMDGAADVLIEGEVEPRRLGAGDYLFLPAHVRHRVTRTDPRRPTVWLAVHVASPAVEQR